jgi:two-component sensor histidine kinase
VLWIAPAAISGSATLEGSTHVGQQASPPAILQTGDWELRLSLQPGIISSHGTYRWIKPLRSHERKLSADDIYSPFSGEQLRTQKALSKALRAKETLLREVHHRVKNNLQVISSLVNMQAASIKDPAAARALDDIQKRVRAMALIHERLQGDDDLDRLDFGEYAGMLAHDLFYSYSIDSARIGLKLELEPVSLELNQAIPCGLILNELLTNSLKYAFPHGRPGEIRVAVACGPNDMVKLTVSDNGIGLAPGFNWAQSQSLGLQIVDTLARQLDGTAVHEPAAGTTFTISFPWNRSNDLPRSDAKRATAPSYFGPRTQPE